MTKPDAIDGHIMDSMTPYEEQGLEILIDRYSLGEILATLADICSDKSDHTQAEPWSQMASRLNTQSDAAHDKGI